MNLMIPVTVSVVYSQFEIAALITDSYLLSIRGIQAVVGPGSVKRGTGKGTIGWGSMIVRLIRLLLGVPIISFYLYIRHNEINE